MMDTADNHPLMATLDFWTEHTLEAYWQELVRETKEVNFTGSTLEQTEETCFTG